MQIQMTGRPPGSATDFVPLRRIRTMCSETIFLMRMLFLTEKERRTGRRKRTTTGKRAPFGRKVSREVIPGRSKRRRAGNILPKRLFRKKTMQPKIFFRSGAATMKHRTLILVRKCAGVQKSTARMRKTERRRTLLPMHLCSSCLPPLSSGSVR